MGIPLSGPVYVYGNNKSAITDSTRPGATLNKKSYSIYYHAIQKLVVMGESILSHVGIADNLANLLTILTFGSKRQTLVTGVLYDIYYDREKKKVTFEQI